MVSFDVFPIISYWTWGIFQRSSCDRELGGVTGDAPALRQTSFSGVYARIF